MFFLDFMGGGAWPFIVGGVICLLNCVNERDLRLLNNFVFLREIICKKQSEIGGNNRSVMPLDVLGCTRATIENIERRIAEERFKS
jgi:hypothetical protein